MTIRGISECWNCGKAIHDNLNVSRFFHCSKKCQKACKTWNFKPPFVDHTPEELKESKETPIPTPTRPGQTRRTPKTKKNEPEIKVAYKCPHKYNCRAHKEVCEARGVKTLGGTNE